MKGYYLMNFKRFIFPALLAALSGGPQVYAAEFEVLDRFSVDGYSVFRGSADIPGGSFTVGGSILAVKDGKVGIGNAAPNSPLEVAKAVTFDSVDTFPQFIVRDAAGSTGRQLGLGVDSGNFAFLQALNRGLDVMPLSLQRYGGNVGIGTTAPGYKLSIYGAGTIRAGLQSSDTSSIASVVYINNTMNYEAGIFADNAYGINYGASRALSVLSNGNVGIGTAAPLSNLQIGAATFTGVYGSYNEARAGLIIGEGAGDIGLVSLQVSSTYNHASLPNYGLVLVNGPTTASYDTWGIMHDGPAKATGGLQFAYAAQGSNIHTVAPMVTFQKSGNIGIGTASPGARLDILSPLVAGGRVRAFNSLHTAANTLQIDQFSPTHAARPSWNILSVSNAEQNLGFVTDNQAAVDAGTSLTGLFIKSGGNVGVGTTGPNYKLDVAGTVNSTGKAWFSYGNNNVSGYTWTEAALNTNSIEIVNDNAVGTGSSPTLGFHRYGSGGPQFRLDSAGTNVLYLESAGAGSARRPEAYGGGTNSYFSRLHVDGQLSTTGNVGIGTTNPSVKLQVAGSLIRTIAYAQGWGVDSTCDNETTTCVAAIPARVLTFNKTSAATKVRVAWVDTMRSYSVSPATVHICQWELKFDGASCPTGNIKGVAYSSPATDTHETRTVWGYCGGLSAGSHTIQGYVSAAQGSPGRCMTGWPGDTNWTIEAEEVN